MRLLSRSARPSHCTGQVILGMLGAEDHVVVEVLELGGLAFHSMWHSRVLASLQAGPLQAVHASEVGLSGLIGVDDVAEVVEDLGRTVLRQSLCSGWLVALPHIGPGWALGARACVRCGWRFLWLKWL